VQTLPISTSETQIIGVENGSDVSLEDAIEKALPRTVREHPERKHKELMPLVIGCGGMNEVIIGMFSIPRL